jgi:hypothetical protein
MKKRNVLMLLLVALSLFALPLKGIVRGETVRANQDALLKKYEKGDRVFKKTKIGNTISYFHQRKIGEAIVEKDFVRYRFDLKTKKLIDKEIKWITPKIAKQEAESKVEGLVQFTRLYIISPESDVFPIKPAPQHPCWIVRSNIDTRIVITIIDAITGEKLGLGMPPPSLGFSLSGTDWGSCDPEWGAWAKNAMGYATTNVSCPSISSVRNYIKSNVTAMFYEIAHGGSTFFHNECPDGNNITAGEVETWIASYANMPFVFLASCEGMCDVGDNTFSYEFRRGSDIDTVTVGYCQMDQEVCADCWDYSKDWQDTLFKYMKAGNTVQHAFNEANLAYPDCEDHACMRIAGDTRLKVAPVVTRSLCETVYDGKLGPLTWSSRGYYISCDVTVPTDKTLTINPNVRVVFLNNSKIIAQGTLSANGGIDAIRFVSENKRDQGMTCRGQIRMLHGGGMRIGYTEK